MDERSMSSSFYSMMVWATGKQGKTSVLSILDESLKACFDPHCSWMKHAATP